jgi:VWFA-related protein
MAANTGGNMARITFLRLAIVLTGLWIGQRHLHAQTTHQVYIPTLVESKPGQIAYGLSSDDFAVKDNGVVQHISMESDPSARPLSLLLVIQTGRNAATHLQDISHLDDLLDGILTSPKDQVGIITFDSRPRLIQSVTSGSRAITSGLAGIQPGDSGSALFDAIHLAVNTLRSVPPESRKVILLVSGQHDHGSNAFDTASLVRDVSSSNASVYSVSFAAGKDRFTRLWSLNPLAMTASAMQRDAPLTLAQLTGGDFYRFENEKQFEESVDRVGNHINNRYVLSFRPSDREPGFHSLQVQVLRPKVSVVSSRSGYWLTSTDPVGGRGGLQ